MKTTPDGSPMIDVAQLAYGAIILDYVTFPEQMAPTTGMRFELNGEVWELTGVHRGEWWSPTVLQKLTGALGHTDTFTTIWQAAFVSAAPVIASPYPGRNPHNG